MLRRCLGVALAVVMVAGIVAAEEFVGNVSKIEDGKITVKSFGGFKKDGAKAEEKSFTVSDDVKVTKSAGKDKDPVKLTLSELKTATKVTNVFVTVVHEDGKASEIKVGFTGGKFGKDKKKEKDTTDNE